MGQPRTDDVTPADQTSPLPANWKALQGAKCGCHGQDDYCGCQNTYEPWKYGLGGSPPSWDGFEDDISDAIQDSIDMDWNSRDGARAVVHWLKERGFRPVGDSSPSTPDASKSPGIAPNPPHEGRNG